MSDLPPEKQGPWRQIQRPGPPPSASPLEPRQPPRPAVLASSNAPGCDTTPSQWRATVASPSGSHDPSARSSEFTAYGCPSPPPPALCNTSWGGGALSRSPPSRYAAPRSGPGGFSSRRSPIPPRASMSTTSRDVAASVSQWRRGASAPAIGVQTAEEQHRYDQFCQQVEARLPPVVGASQCDPDKEYAQYAGGFVEVTDTLLASICPANLVGKPCLLDYVSAGCPMIRLCGQLEKWITYVCPDKGFRTVVDTAAHIPVSYSGKFGRVTYCDSSDNESVGAALSSEEDLEEGDFQPEYRGQKVSFNDFSCGVKNDCGHIHWEVEINCRFIAAQHIKSNAICRQVLDKGRLCSVGHDLEKARQQARDAVADHEREAKAMGAAGVDLAEIMSSRWVY